MKKILLVEDDAALAMGTEYALRAEGYEVLHAKDLAEARNLVIETPDIILLDVMLPDGNGFGFIRELRNAGNTVPVIFLTAVSDEVNIVQGLDSGADDYVTKPYRVKELLSRIAAVLRRQDMLTSPGSTNKVKTDSISFGSHTMDISGFRLYRDGKPVDCTVAEFRLLKELAEHPGQVITRSMLMDCLYESGDSFIDDNTLSVYMKRLRDKLGEDADNIETVRGVGYRFRKE